MKKNRKNPEGAILVVGGGVGGMRAAIDLAEAGLKVYLVERDAGLGGRVAQLGYMFPTHDCVLCRGTSDHGYGCTRPAISPAFMDNNQHPNIEIMTQTEIVDASGQAGNFTVTLQHQPRYVDADRCTNCGLCAIACPQRMPSEFQESIVSRMAIHKTAPRAIPNTYIIDKGDYCDDCHRCEDVCPTGAINLNEKPQEEKVAVSAIILALGYKLVDPGTLAEFGYNRYTNVVHSMQYERFVSRSGPTNGLVLRPSDNTTPKRIAWLQCIGSRDQDHPYCSSICCMYASKEAILAKQRIDDVHCQIFMMDERAFNKEFNSYFKRSHEEYGVEYTRCRISQLDEDPTTNDLIIKYLEPRDKQIKEEPFDMVVLSVGMEPPSGAATLAQKLNFALNQYGFCKTDKFNPLETSRAGIYVCGAFSSPKEISDTLIDSAGAAGDVMRLFNNQLGKAPYSREYPFLSNEDFPPERDISNEKPRVGVFVCRCHPSIEGPVSIERLIAKSRTYPYVVHAEEIGYGCFPEGQQAIKDAIAEHDLNRVVVAGCSDRTHKSLFQRTIKEAGLNAYLLEMANIREFCAWVHPHEPEKATRKAMELIRVATGRASTLQPIYKSSISPTQRALVIGGGISGMTSALAVADSGFNAVLVERENELGGNLNKIQYLVGGENPQQLLRDLVNRVRVHEHIDVYNQTEVVSHEGHAGAYHSLLRHQDGGETKISHGATIVATGGHEARGSQYLLGQHPNVLTQLELEDTITHRMDEVAELDDVVMIQCVRPDGADHDYCSRICCTSTIKNAIRLKVINPDCNVTVLYKDIITYGFREQYYTDARERGVIFVRYDNENKPQVKSINGNLRVQLQEPMLDQPLSIDPGLLVLSTAIVPSNGTQELAKLLNVPLSTEGFFLEAHIKMRPMDFMEEGIFLCGIAHYPKFIEESISQALATAGRATTILSEHPYYYGGVIAVVDTDKCVGCLTCTRTCPFEIPKVDDSESGVGSLGGAAYIEPNLCHGCGTCAGECPANAIQLMNYTDTQIMVPEYPVLGSWVTI
ncbi:MAG: FAD-dependent oxidoreductase [Chloroflexota bacterium]|nr:FAD-dependent oxidoreductase [Chloroflexota bacterium]